MARCLESSRQAAQSLPTYWLFLLLFPVQQAQEGRAAGAAAEQLCTGACRLPVELWQGLSLVSRKRATSTVPPHAGICLVSPSLTCPRFSGLPGGLPWTHLGSDSGCNTEPSTSVKFRPPDETVEVGQVEAAQV